MTGFPVYQIIFYVFSAVLIASAIGVVTSRNTVYGVMALILAFFASAVLWISLQSEFLGLMLIFVYVGAVMTLLLFVVMMLNIDLEKIREKFVRFLPAAIIVLGALSTILILTLRSSSLRSLSQLPEQYSASYSNTKALGTLLFTAYLYPFEISAMILLVAMISAIALAFFGRKPGVKSQNTAQQHRVTKQERLRVVPIEPEKRDAP